MSSDKKIITLRSADNEIFELTEAVATQLETIKNMMEETCATGAIPLSNVRARLLSKVIEYCKKHSLASTSWRSMPGTKDFVQAEPSMIFGLMLVSVQLFDLI
ncbi:hypothetical protein L6164_031170 [Bauhinia variegata]|uniref:Uncharacterized protein n=1 Tax=Bauhinia variegata TaxID=167791 RepID=A0ACB9LF37_BAUVA|nr:hypothetical protein L6164_031170 [Bauhinia variegata]